MDVDGQSQPWRCSRMADEWGVNLEAAWTWQSMAWHAERWQNTADLTLNNTGRQREQDSTRRAAEGPSLDGQG